MPETETETLPLHLAPLDSTRLLIRSGDFDLELAEDGSKATLWLSRHLIASWYAGDGQIHWLGGTEGL